MQILKRKEIRARIGKKGLFSEFPNLIDKLNYHSGITGFDQNQAKPMKGELISLIGHPKGMEIRLNATGQSTALLYNEITCYEIESDAVDNNLLRFFISSQIKIEFSFDSRFEIEVIKYLRELNITKKRLDRIESEIQEQISSLKADFNPPPNYSVNILQEFDTGIFGKNKTIKITNETLEWNGITHDLSKIAGVTYAKSISKVNGITAHTSFEIGLYKEGALVGDNIIFGRPFGTGEKNAESIYELILNAVDNLCVRPIIISWIDLLSKSNRIETNEFELSRQGIHHRRRGNQYTILWEDAAIEQFELTVKFQSKYDKYNSLKLSLNLDPLAWPLLQFVIYLQTNPSKQKLISG